MAPLCSPARDIADIIRKRRNRRSPGTGIRSWRSCTSERRADLAGSRAKLRLEPGDCLAVNSNVLHCAAPAPECELHSLVFDPSLVFGSGESVFAGTYIRPLISETSFDGVLLGQGEQAKETELFRTAFEALADEKFGYEFTVRECLSKICLVLCRRFQHEVAKEQTGADQDQVRIREMLDYIHCHYRDEISLEDIAGAADIGTRECLRCFRRMIRISPIQYLLRYRIMQGAELLVREPLWSVSEIAPGAGLTVRVIFLRCSGGFIPARQEITAGQTKNNWILDTDLCIIGRVK